MKKSLLFIVSCFALISFASGQSRPSLKSGLMPRYPPFALAAKVEGEVKVAFVLNDNGGVESVDVKSGPAMLKEATADIVKSWKFAFPERSSIERKFETIFKYHLSGTEVESGKTPKLTIIEESFRRIDVMSDSLKTEVVNAY